MAKKYNVSDGKLLLILEEAEEGGFTVTSPLDPALVTEADTISEAFMMARDAMKTIAASRRKSMREERQLSVSRRGKNKSRKGRVTP